MQIHSAGRRRLGNALDNVLKDAGVVERGKYVVVLDVVARSQHGDLTCTVLYKLADHPQAGGNSD